MSAVVNPSDAKGGTLRMAQSADWDSLDPADTYYAYSWNFIRLYGRSRVMFKAGPGSEGTTLTPDLVDVMLADAIPTEDVGATAQRFGVELHRVADVWRVS